MLRVAKQTDTIKPQINAKAVLRGIVRHLPMAAAFFLISIAQVFSVPSPYAVCCLMAVLTVDRRAPGAAAGLCMGLVFRILWGIDWDVWQFIACALCYGVARMPWQNRKQLYLLTAGLLLFRNIPRIADAPDVQTVLLAVAGFLMGMVSMPALCRGAQHLKQKPREWNEDDVLCLLLPCLVLVSGAARLSAFQVNLGCAGSVFAVLALSWVAGGSAGMCCGLGCGLALLLGGQSALMLVILTFGALLAGLFQGKMRLLSAGVFLLSAVTLTYLIAFSFQPHLFYAALSGSVVFMLVPGKAMRRMGTWVRAVCWSQPKENAYTRLKMQRWVRSIDRMAEALPHPRMEMPAREEESERLTEALCFGCERMPICWHDQFEETRAGMDTLANREDDPEKQLEVINRYFSACPRISRLPSLLTKLDAERQERRHRALCAEYERDMLQTHLTALSQAAQRISLEGGDPEESYWASQVDEALEALRFPGKADFVKKVDGHWIVCVQCEPLSLRPAAGGTLSRQIGIYLNTHLEIKEQQNGRILLEEQPPLSVQTGMATACAVNLERKRKTGQSPDNGDAVLTKTLSGGKMLLALSDGMGHGTGAQDESRKTLEMLSLCMEAGYTRTQATTAVNGAMLSATAGEKFATVDLCLIDLWTGEAAVNKLGACASILMQGQKTQWIEGEALPLGIIEHVVPMEHHFTLAGGDLMLMMSDGITDAFRTDEEILSIVKQNRLETPQHIANTLLQEAIIQKDGLPPDDMTVLCARVKEGKNG